MKLILSVFRLEHACWICYIYSSNFILGLVRCAFHIIIFILKFHFWDLLSFWFLVNMLSLVYPTQLPETFHRNQQEIWPELSLITQPLCFMPYLSGTLSLLFPVSFSWMGTLVHTFVLKSYILYVAGSQKHIFRKTST